jgi:hypothetical protein
MFYREGQAVKNPSLKGLWAAPKGTAQGTRKNNKRKLILSLCLAPCAFCLKPHLPEVPAPAECCKIIGISATEQLVWQGLFAAAKSCKFEEVRI